MTEVEFHTGVADKIGFACRLLRKAYRKGARLAVTGPAPLLTALDRALWTFDEREFVPHLRVAAAALPTPAAQRTPIWLLDGNLDGARPEGAPEVLINLGAAAPAEPARWSRIIEVLGTDVDDAQQGRQRWRDYKASGMQVLHHGAARGA